MLATSRVTVLLLALTPTARTGGEGAMCHIEGACLTHGALIGLKGAGQTMQIHAFLGSDPVIKVGETDLQWKTIEVAFIGGMGGSVVVESAVAEHGLSTYLRDETMNEVDDPMVVGCGDLSGSGKTYPSGLVMTVTFSSYTHMDEVMIDFTSTVTAITTKDPATLPTVAFAALAPNGRVATIVQDTRNEIYAFAPGVGIQTIELENPDVPPILRITTLQDGLSVSAAHDYFGLAFLDGSGRTIEQEVPIAACSEPLDPSVSGHTFVSISSHQSPPPEFDYTTIVVGAEFFDPCETCGFPFADGSTILYRGDCAPNAAGDKCVSAQDGAECYVAEPVCSCDGLGEAGSSVPSSTLAGLATACKAAPGATSCAVGVFQCFSGTELCTTQAETCIVASPSPPPSIAISPPPPPPPPPSPSPPPSVAQPPPPAPPPPAAGSSPHPPSGAATATAAASPPPPSPPAATGPAGGVPHTPLTETSEAELLLEPDGVKRSRALPSGTVALLVVCSLLGCGGLLLVVGRKYRRRSVRSAPWAIARTTASPTTLLPPIAAVAMELHGQRATSTQLAEEGPNGDRSTNGRL